MRTTVRIPGTIADAMRRHLFKDTVEQAAFLFTTATVTETECLIVTHDVYLVPPEGWDVQHEVYLEMSDAERAKIMKMARDRGMGVVDCHSHPRSGRGVQFSPSDLAHLPDFAAYAKWKLEGKPFAALVWGEESVDGRIWFGNFATMHQLDEVVIEDQQRFRLPPARPSTSRRDRRRV